MKKSIQELGLLAIITAGLLGIAASTVSAQHRPNIVYILVDNWGWGDIWWILEGHDYPRLWWELIEEEADQ